MTYYTGIDIGSTATKVVVLSDGAVADRFTLPTGWSSKETAGEVATYNGAYIDAVYYSSNGGASIDSSIPWGGSQSSYPYLVGVEDPQWVLVGRIIIT